MEASKYKNIARATVPITIIAITAKNDFTLFNALLLI